MVIDTETADESADSDDSDSRSESINDLAASEDDFDWGESDDLKTPKKQIDNKTEQAITSFERFAFPEWSREFPLEINGEHLPLRVLRLQLLYGGAFCTNMELIDLSTPAHIRFDVQDVLDLLKDKREDKMHRCTYTLNSINKLVLPNVKELTSGDMVKKILEDFCGVLCGENGKIRELVLRSDEISNEFTTGDLGWVEDFLSSYNLDTVTIYPAKSRNKEYKKFCKKLCHGKKKIDNDDKESFKLKRPAPQDTSNACKRAHTETESGEDSKTSNSDQANDELTKMSSNNSYYTVLWDQWKTDRLHEKGVTGKGVTVALLDSGINIAHAAFEGRIVVVNDITCSGNIDLTTDRSGHGTLCASIACGAAFKSFGSKGQNIPIPAGVAPGANIIMYKITEKAGQADAAMITKALEQCLEDKERLVHGIDIVLLPYGSPNYDLKLRKAVDAVVSQGVLVVTASGNYGEWEGIPYPAKFCHTICVGAHDKHGRTTHYTSGGQALDFTAPGKNLTGASSTHPTKFKTGRGTSLAAACVAGLLALIIQRSRDLAEIKSNAKSLLDVKPSVNELVYDQDTIKKVLRQISKNSEHKTSDGYGLLKPTNMLLGDKELLEMLYKDVLKTTMRE